MSDNLTEKQLKWGYWFLTHKRKLKKILLIGLICVNVGLWGYSIPHFVVYFVTGQAHQNILKVLSDNLVDYRLRAKFQPQELTTTNQKVLSSLAKYDFIAEVTNPNPNWAITSLTYRFSWPGGAAETRETFLLPGETKYILTLGQSIKGSRPQNVQCEFLEINWRRLKKPALEKAAEIDIVVEDIEFIPAAIFVKDKQKVTTPNRLQFSATNKTIYNFWQIKFNIILFQGKNIVGVNSAPLEQFLSGQTRIVSAAWPEKLPAVTKALVQPEINILDPATIMPLRGGAGEIK